MSRCEEVGGAQSEKQAFQCGRDHHRISRIGERSQHDQHFAQLDFLRQARAAGHDGNVAFGKRGRVARNRRLPIGENQKVTRLLARRDARSHERGDQRSIDFNNCRRADRRRLHGVAHHAGGNRRWCSGTRDQRTECRLHAACFCRQRALKVRIHKGADCRSRSEIRRQRKRRAEFRETLPDPLVDQNVGATESIDALLWITNHKQRARSGSDCPPVVSFARIGREQQTDFCLHGIGILEFVHQQISVAFSELVAHVRMFTQQSRAEQQQVVEAEHAARVASRRKLVHRAAEHSHRDRVAILTPLLDDWRRGDVEERHEVRRQLPGRILSGFVAAPALLRQFHLPGLERVKHRAAGDRISPSGYAAVKSQAVRKQHQRIRPVLVHRRRQCGQRAVEQIRELQHAHVHLRHRHFRRGKLHVVKALCAREGVVQIGWIESALIESPHVRIIEASRRVDPPTPECARHRQFVVFRDLFKFRIEANLERSLAQQPRAERVNGSEEGAVEVTQRSRASSLRFCGGLRIADHALQTQLESLAQFVRGFTRECDRSELLNRRTCHDVPDEPRNE